MPELPEVETVRRGLEPAMQGKRIVRADVRRPDLRWPFPPRMAERLSGQDVIALRRRSKYLLADLSSHETLIWHLGMSGRVLITGDGADAAAAFHHAQPTPQKHDHVVFHMEGGVTVAFNDARRFGAMDLCDTAHVENHRLLTRIGPEPFGNSFNEAHLSAALAGRKAPIKAVLLDQRTVAGLGNIYVCEILYRAGISPLRQSGKIGKTRIAALVPIVRDVLQDAIDAGGSSLRDHRQTDGDLGYFQHSFRVYGREGANCLTPDCKGTVRRVVQSGRSSFYCPNCQR